MENNQYDIVSLEDIQSFEKKINHHRLTTGLYAILWAIKNYQEVIIHGYDFFIDSKTHYYNSKIANIFNQYIFKRGNKHNNESEKTFVEKMIEKNQIKKIEDIV